MSLDAVADLTYGHHSQARGRADRTLKINDCVLRLTLNVIPTTDLQGNASPLPTPAFDARPCPPTAVCFRVGKGFRVAIKASIRKGEGKDFNLAPANDMVDVVAPAPAPIGALYFRRRAFVSNSVTATFTNGMLTKLQTKDPSAIATALQIPVEVLKSVSILVRL